VETPEEIAVVRSDAEAIHQALAQLQPQFREVIVLREINQMNYREIAQIINVPIGTVMSRLSRSRQLLLALHGDRKETRVASGTVNANLPLRAGNDVEKGVAA